MKKYDVRKLKNPNVRLKVSENQNTKLLKCNKAETIEKSLKVKQKIVRELRYADDKIVFSNTLINKITETSRKYELDINTSKTKLMIISKKNITGTDLFRN
ncbi:unnamed protein product [Diabrotica balteata]|uniref:Uncharacterized protein n=1 Tax=Diabrotica balteata TaxID=107213 RepID=A0A9N9X5S9_DIABA|nr:unnamed protein product [Diabrotica balteata]